MDNDALYSMNLINKQQSRNVEEDLSTFRLERKKPVVLHHAIGTQQIDEFIFTP